MKELAQGHSAIRGQSQDLSQVCLTPKSKPSITTCVSLLLNKSAEGTCTCDMEGSVEKIYTSYGKG